MKQKKFIKTRSSRLVRVIEEDVTNGLPGSMASLWILNS